MTRWKAMFKERPHVEVCRGSSDQNIDYIYKRGSEENLKKASALRWGPYEEGEPIFIPARNDPKKLLNDVVSGKSLYEIAKENPHFVLSNPFGLDAVIKSRDRGLENLSKSQQYMASIRNNQQNN